MALGEILKSARVQKGLTPSDVAEGTHMMVQIVEDLEREDFRRIAAPIYGRGFVKLYAEMLALDPEPLVRDFMDLYSGARAPAVRTKQVEGLGSTVSEPPRHEAGAVKAPVPPQRQTVQPKPLVRPLSVSQPAVRVEEEPTPPDAGLTKADGGAACATTGEPLLAAASDGDRPELVVEPEEAFAESDEPDLFRPQHLRRRPVAEAVAREDERAAGKPKHPIFKIGGRLPSDAAPEEHDAVSHERRRARIQAFVDGFDKLRSGVERKLPTALPHKELVALGGVGLVLVVCMAVGIHMLFKMTGSNVKDTPGVLIEAVAPPPDLYVD